VLSSAAPRKKACCSHRWQAEAIGRLQLIQLVGLEIEKLTNEYREVAKRSKLRSDPADEKL